MWKLVYRRKLQGHVQGNEHFSYFQFNEYFHLSVILIADKLHCPFVKYC